MQDTTTPPLPPGVRQLAHEHKLGRLQHIYAVRPATLMARAPGAVCLLVGGLLIALFLTFSATLFDGWPSWQSSLVFLLGPLWLAAGLWLLLTPLLRPRTPVLQYEQGLIYSTRKQEVIRWNQVAELRKKVLIPGSAAGGQGTHISRYYTLQRTDGAHFSLTDELQGLEHLGRVLEAQVTRCLLPVALQTYNAAQPVTFGALTLHQQGIAVQKLALLPWQDVAHISISDLSISIYQKGEAQPWATLSSAAIPNLGVLKELIDYVRATLISTPLPALLVLYQAGLSLTFGAISISRQGVTLRNGTHFSWQEIASIAVGASELLIHKQGEQQWYALPITMLTEAATLRTLLEAIMRGEAH